MPTNAHIYYQNTTLLVHYITPTCFNHQMAIFRENNWYITAARSTKWVTRCKIQLSESV